MVAALTGVFATAAHAQSSVTLYGLIDAGITYTNNQQGHSNWKATSGSVNGSRWGLRGSEDLGGGLKAIFTLENGFNIMNGTNGQGGREFGRQAFVGLSSNQFGAVTLGRQYDSVVDFLGPLALTGTQYGGTQFAHPFDNDNLDNSFRVNNSVKYTSANFGGFKFGGMYGFSNEAGGFADNRAYSVGASYNYGPLNIAAAYLQLNKSGSSNLSGAVSQGDGTAAIAADLQRTYGAGINYTYGPATAGFVYTHTQLDGISGVNVGGTTLPGIAGTNLHLDNYEVNGRYALTPALSLAAAYTFTDGKLSGSNGSGDPKWHTVSLQGDYSLSKRTDVYVEGVYQHASGELGNFGSNVAAINTLAPSSTGNQVAAAVGLRHRF